MEIKQGDKVRVSSRVPRIYERYGSMIAPHYECKVVEIDDGMALLDSIPVKHIFLFPLKYLVKVETEAKEAKIKCGDKVLAMKTDQITPSSKAETFRRNVSLVTKIKDGIATLFIIDRFGANHYARTAVEFLQKITDEPMEHTEASADVLGEFTPISMSVNPIIGFEQAYWQEYEADLAKELAISYAKRGKSPLDAVAAAKEITKRLKQK